MNIQFRKAFNPFMNRKIGIWLEDTKFKSSALNQGHLNPRLGFEFQKEDLVLRNLIQFTSLNSKEDFKWNLGRILKGPESIGQRIIEINRSKVLEIQNGI
jgi:hypothetical protein